MYARIRLNYPQFYLLMINALLVLSLQAAAEEDARSAAAARFAANCAVCHGPQGRPDPDSDLVKSLGVTPANFSDALFNSREPATDWFLVVKYGGPALGFSQVMPSFKDMFTDEEILELIEYVKTLAGAHDYPSGAMNFLLPLRTKKAFPEDEVVWKLRYADEGAVDEIKNTIEIEKRFGTRWQGMLELNHVITDGDGEFEALEPGLKYVLVHDESRDFILSLAGQFAIPLTEDGSPELLPYLALGKGLGEQFTLQASARAKLPTDNIDDGSVELSAIVHWVHSIWPRNFFPGLEFTGEIPLDRGTGPGRSDFMQISVIPQARIGLSKRGHVALNSGVELPLNDTDRFDYRGYVFLIWDFADGPFTDGW